MSRVVELEELQRCIAILEKVKSLERPIFFDSDFDKVGCDGYESFQVASVLTSAGHIQVVRVINDDNEVIGEGYALVEDKIPKPFPINFDGKVYLMRNERNGYTKIGFSKNPSYREKTLQSEEPEINLICFTDGCYGYENHLHERYAKFRLRGEWFDLSADQIEEIKSEFSEREIPF